MHWNRPQEQGGMVTAVSQTQEETSSFSLEYVYGSIGGRGRDTPVDLAEGSCLDLLSLVAVRGLGTVGHHLGLYAAHVPKLRAPVVGEGRKHGAVGKHSDSVGVGGRGV